MVGLNTREPNGKGFLPHRPNIPNTAVGEAVDEKFV
jgi:hypothetical protein